MAVIQKKTGPWPPCECQLVESWVKQTAVGPVAKGGPVEALPIPSEFVAIIGTID